MYFLFVSKSIDMIIINSELFWNNINKLKISHLFILNPAFAITSFETIAVNKTKQTFESMTKTKTSEIKV